jgi:hypothetical protein
VILPGYQLLLSHKELILNSVLPFRLLQEGENLKTSFFFFGGTDV